jgi:ankyrin repeat protein
MTSSELPEAVVMAVKIGDLAQLQHHCESGTSLEEIAKQAARTGQPQVLEWCYAQGWAAKSPSFNDDFFLSAISGRSPAVFQILLNHGWDINAHETEACGDALASAIMDEDYDFTKWLLEHGHRATPKQGNYGDSALSTIVRVDGGSVKMLKLLLDHGINLQEEGLGMYAANDGNLEALKMLLDYGLDTEDRTVQFYPFDGDEEDPYASEGTALYRACRQGHLECVRLLLERGANAKAKDDGGTSCLAIAKKRNYQEIVKLLTENGATE